MPRIARKYVWWIVLFLALCVLCYLFPYAHDDWAWGSQIGMGRLDSGFADYGGRYLGYVIVMVLTRLRILRAIFMAGVLMGIGICIKKLMKTGWALFAALTLMFLMAREIFAQSVSWVSGFANYATTALVVLVFLVIVVEIIMNKKKETPLFRGMMPLLGLGGCLIMENVTVYLVVMSILLQIYLWVKEKRFSVGLLLFSLGAVVGAVWMFSNSAYHNIMNSQDEYRAVASSWGGKLRQAGDNYVTDIYPYGLFKNVILNVSFTVVGILILAVDKAKRTRVAQVSLAVFGLYTIYTVISEFIVGVVEKPDWMIYGEAVMSCLALISLVVFVILLAKKHTEQRKKLILLWITFFILVGPLFLITPIGPRNFFAPYMILVTINLLEWRMLLEILKDKKTKWIDGTERYLEKVSFATVISVVVVMIGIFAVVYRADVNRLQKVRDEVRVGQKTVVIKHLPFESMMWGATPMSSEFSRRYKMFYEIPEDVEIVVEDK